MPIVTSTQGSSLADILERVLDKGLVIAGDITISLADVDLLKIRVRLLIASVDKAEAIGINWWRHDPSYGIDAGRQREELAQLRQENELLRQHLDDLEQRLRQLTPPRQDE